MILFGRKSTEYVRGYDAGYGDARRLYVEEARNANRKLQEYQNIQNQNLEEKLHAEVYSKGIKGTLLIEGIAYEVYVGDIRSVKTSKIIAFTKAGKPLQDPIYLDKYIQKITLITV